MIVHAADVPLAEREQGRFAVKVRRLADAAGGKQIGCSLVELPPGKDSWPFHYHLVNEEAVYVLEGEGVLRYGEEEIPLRPGDYVALRAGPPAYQMKNRSAAPLRYLAFATKLDPEICVYPDSGKVGIWAEEKGLIEMHQSRNAVDYWDGEQ